ncbi:MAG: glycosyltransferase family 2 protein [Candidatus Dormibacteria bacterium]
MVTRGRQTGRPLGELLISRHALRRRALDLGLRHQRLHGGLLGEVLVAHRFAREDDVWAALGEQWGLPLDGLTGVVPDPALCEQVPMASALRYGIIPLRRRQEAVDVAFIDPTHPLAMEAAQAALGATIRPVLGTPSSVHRLQAQAYRTELVTASTLGLQRGDPEASAQEVLTHHQVIFLFVLALLAVVGIGLLRAGFFIVLAGLVILLYAGVVAFRTYITYRGGRYGHGATVSREELDQLADLPTYTILCPLFREAGVLPQLVRACAALDYPRARLDVQLLLEEDDAETRAAIAEAQLPTYIRVVVVPAEGQRTKPKACNYGLQLAQGEYTVIFDAEDIPEPDQLRKAIAIFRRSGPDLACVQAKLAYYNSRQNLLTGWFSLEYTSWFEFFLPGLESLGLPIPLGGSSNHLRTSSLRLVGGWDPDNVTEDADLGMRLLRRGYRTVMMDSTTHEEANSDFVNWVRQRSRWGKGYAITWLVQMRHPLEVVRTLGFSGFVSIQLTLGGTYAISLLNLLMWFLTSLWILAQLGFIAYLFPGWIYYLAMLELLLGNFFFLYLNLWSAAYRRDFHLSRLALLTPIYWLMMSVAMIKATLQLFSRPAFWEKTIHGLYVEPGSLPSPGFAGLAARERATRARH